MKQIGQPSDPILSYPILSAPISSCPILSYPILSSPILSSRYRIPALTTATSRQPLASDRQPWPALASPVDDQRPQRSPAEDRPFAAPQVCGLYPMLPHCPSFPSATNGPSKRSQQGPKQSQAEQGVSSVQ